MVCEKIKKIEDKNDWIQWLSLAIGGYSDQAAANRATPLAMKPLTERNP